MRPEFQFGTTPRPHQRETFERSKDMEAFALFWGTAVGKTKTVLDTAAYLYCADKIDALVVFAPNGVHRQWVKKAIPVHMPPIFYAAGYYSARQGKQERAQLDQVRYASGLRVLTMNTEALAHLSGYNYAAQFVQDAGRTLVAIDESQGIKSPSAATTQYAWRLRSKMKKAKEKLPGMGDLIRYRRILSGSPVVQGLEDLYAQFRFLDSDILGCQTFAEFKTMYCKMVLVAGYPKISGYQNVQHMRQRLAPYVSSIKREDVLQHLPARDWDERFVELSLEQKRAYKELRLDYQTQLANGSWVVGDSAIVRLRQLQQIVAGHVTDPATRGLPPDQRKVIELPCPRAAVCVEEVQKRLPRKTIVWAEERFEIDRLYRLFVEAGFTPARLYGGITGRARDREVDGFQDDPTINPMISNPGSGGAGFEFQMASYAIYYSHGWSYGDRYQSEGRIHRDGSAHPVLYTDLIAPGTVDARIRRRVKDKQEVARMIEELEPEQALALAQELLGDEDEEGHENPTVSSFDPCGGPGAGVTIPAW